AGMEAIVSDSYAWFRGMVKARGHLDDAALERVADGRVFTGRQGVALKLVDEIGDERAALAWLAKEKNIDPTTPVRDYRLRDRFGDLPFLHTAMVTTLEAVGLSSFPRRPEGGGAVQAGRRPKLGVLLALWPPAIANSRRSDSFRQARDGSSDDQVRARAAHLVAEPASLPARRGKHRQRHSR